MTPEIMLAVQMAVGLVFLAAALAKAIHPRDFFESLQDYALPSKQVRALVGSIVIALEAFVALTHVSGWNLELGMIVAICLIVMFTAAVARALGRGITASCLCFGATGTDLISKQSLLRLALIGACEGLLVGLWLSAHRWPAIYALTTSGLFDVLICATAILLAASVSLGVAQIVFSRAGFASPVHKSPVNP